MSRGITKSKPSPLIVDGHAVGYAGMHRRTAERLRKMIVHCELAPGSIVSEAGLCLKMGGSRTPLREALKILAAEGLVELRPNRSPRIRPLPVEEITQLFEALAGIERVAVELAVERVNPATIRRLRASQDRLEVYHGEGRREAYFEENEKLHRMIVAAAGNTVLEETHSSLLTRARRVRFAALEARGRWDESVEEHREVLAALFRHDAGQAGNLLFSHVVRTGKAVTGALAALASESVQQARRPRPRTLSVPIEKGKETPG